MRRTVFNGVISVLLMALILFLTVLTPKTEAAAVRAGDLGPLRSADVRQQAETAAVKSAASERAPMSLRQILRQTRDQTLCIDYAPTRTIPDGPLALPGGRLCLIQNGFPAPPGLAVYETDVYCVGEDGLLLTDDTWETMRFDSEGRYTSGNPEIDAFVKTLILNAAGGRTGQAALEACYQSITAQVRYQAGSRVDQGAPAETWTEEAMLRLMERGRGNCYCYAAEMYYVARQLGFQARAVSGAVDRPAYAHGWVELELEGETRILDPELNHTRRSWDPMCLCLVSADAAPFTYFRP